MQKQVKITSLKLVNFKAFSNFRLSLDEMNILVGSNNSGKSTILSAFRALDTALQKASRKKPEILNGPNGPSRGWRIETLPISLDNVHTDYADTDTQAIFTTSHGGQLTLFFPKDGGCILIAKDVERAILTPTSFRKYYPISVAQVPTLGPVEQDENVLKEDYVRRHLATHRAPRHFRNYWYHFPARFDKFAELVNKTWAGMEIAKPERVSILEPRLVMFCREERFDRELFWSGFGFQVWCQLLTHIIAAQNSTIFVLDEPETYLHPELQRQLVGILRDLPSDIILATHSTEIMTEADPSEILSIDKGKNTAHRLKDVSHVQEQLKKIGSIQNITLTQLARNRKVLFTEGDGDFRIIRRFARLLGYDHLAAGQGLTPVESDGFSNWQRIEATSWGLQKTLGEASLTLAAIFDRDYRCSEEIEDLEKQLGSRLEIVHFHRCKEIENYLLKPAPLQRALERAVADRCNRQGLPLPNIPDVRMLIIAITKELKSRTQSAYIAHRRKYLRDSGRSRGLHDQTIDQQTLDWFDDNWDDLDNRTVICPGKETLKKLREVVQQDFGISLTESRIIDAYHKTEVPDDIRLLIDRLENYRTAKHP